MLTCATDPVLNLQLAARALVAANFPGRYAVEVVIYLNQTAGAKPRPVRVFMPSPGSLSAASGDAPAAPAEPPRPPPPTAPCGAVEPPAAPPGVFEPSELQGDIIEALEWKGMTAGKLATAVGVSERYLYRKPGGLAELIDHGMIRNTHGVGYWRPDAPPTP
jgi:hypothetical protein